MSVPMMTVLCGLPGAGKSTLAATGKYGMVATADGVRRGEDPRAVFSAMHARIAAALARGEDVCVDTCALRPQARRELQAIARAAGAATRAVLLRTPPHICQMRDDRRKHKAGVDWGRAMGQLNDTWRALPREGWGEVVIIR